MSFQKEPNRVMAVYADSLFTAWNLLYQKEIYLKNKKHLKIVGPIRHCKRPHAACFNFTLPFTRCRYC